MVRTNQHELVSIVVTSDGRRIAVPFRGGPESSPLAVVRDLARRCLAVLARSLGASPRRDT